MNYEAEIVEANDPNQERGLQAIPLNTILHMKSMLIAKEIAETPKKKPEGEYRWDAFEPAVTYTAQSSYAQRRATARRRRIATAPATEKRKPKVKTFRGNQSLKCEIL